MLDASQQHPSPAAHQPLAGRLPRVKRNRAQMAEAAPHTRDWPGPHDFPQAEPPKSEVVEHAKWLADKRRFEMNCVAAQAYHDEGMTEGEVNSLLFKRFKKRLAQGSIWKLLERCKTFNPQTQRIHGFWACIPRYRPTKLREPARRASTNCMHALNVLFRDFPHIEANLVEYIVRRTPDIKVMRPTTTVTPELVWDVFLGECKSEGMNLAPKRWPFTHKVQGYEAIRRWYHEEKYRNPSAAARNELTESTAKAVQSAYATIGAPKIGAGLTMAYSRVELDEHKFDAEFTMFIPGEGDDEWIAVPQGRIYVLAMIEVESGAVLAVDIGVDQTFTSTEVKGLIHDAVFPPPKPTTFRIEDDEWRLAEGAAFPAELPEFERCVWQELAMDRASQHRTVDARSAIKTVTGCQIAFDKPEQPLSRGVIEGGFKALARLAKRLESATGNRPDSPSRRDSAAGAVRSRLTRNFLREMLQIFCRNYNATKKKGTGRSPIETLRDRLRQDRCFIGRVGDAGYNNRHLLLEKKEANLTERAARSHGPVCVYLGYEYYLGVEMSSRHELLRAADTKVDIYVERDARFAVVVPRAFPEHRFTVVLCGLWASEPHPLWFRMMVKSNAVGEFQADRAEKPLLGLAAARGLARVASRVDGMAQMLAGYFAFADQYGRGEVPYLTVTAEQRTNLLAWVQGESADSGVSGPASESAPVQPATAAPAASTQPGLRPVAPPPSSPRKYGDEDDEDDYGILQGPR